MTDLFDTGPVAVLSVIGQSCISLCHIHHTDTLCKSSQRKCHIAIVHITEIMKMHLVQKWQTILRSDRLQHLPRNGIDRPCHRLSDMHISPIASPGILRTVFDRMIIHNRRRRKLSGLKSRSIVDQWLDGASWLASRQVCPVVRIFCTTSAYNGYHVIGIVIHTDCCSLQRIFSAVRIFLRIICQSAVNGRLKLFLFFLI